MKEIQKEKKVFDTWYQATDGTEFRTREECEKYEQTAHAVVRQKFLKLVIADKTEYDFFHVGSDDTTVYAVKMDSQEEADTVLQLYFLDNPYVLRDEENPKKYKEEALNMVNTAYQEQDILFVGENYEGEIFLINTRANIIEDLQMIDQPKQEEKKDE